MNTPEQLRLNRQIERVLRTLKKGTRARTPYFDITVPNPKPNTLVFHRTTYSNGFVTLQAETKILDRRLSPKEVKHIFATLAKIVEINNQRSCARLRRFNNVFLFVFAMIFWPFPICLFFPFGVFGLAIGVIVYLSCLLGLIFLYFYQ